MNIRMQNTRTDSHSGECDSLKLYSMKIDFFYCLQCLAVFETVCTCIAFTLFTFHSPTKIIIIKKLNLRCVKRPIDAAMPV